MSFDLVSTNAEAIIYKRKKKSIPLIQKSLAVVLTSLQGHQIIFELKNDTEVHGKIDSVGHGMDTYLSGARVIDSRGTVYEHEILFVSGVSIRYVHLPPDINITSHLSAYMRHFENTSMKSLPHKLVDKKRKLES